MSVEPRALLLTGVLLATLPGAPVDAAGPFTVDPADPRLDGRPELVARLTGSAHDYFRFINVTFAAEACAAFGDVLDELPDVNLHGDAHLEQFAVTSIGFGLTDFDDCTQGKPIIDLVRFGTSLMLAAREHGWHDEDGRFLDDFFRGYRDGLKKSRLIRPMPERAAEIRAGFQWDRAVALRQAHEFIDVAPLPPESFAETAAEFAELMRSGRDDLPLGFFQVKRVGALSMGVGSALDEKYLVIFEGQTEADDDDLIVEAKQIRDLSGNPCLRTDVGAARILAGERVIAYEPFAFSAVVARGDTYFWIHDWTDDYQELSVTTGIRSKKDLKQIAYDAGVQLGRAHPKRPDGSPDKAQQKAMLKALKRFEGRIRGLARRLANETEAAWRDFTEAAGRLPTD
jgi:uncharacterized protein (DUF2252 family)